MLIRDVTLHDGTDAPAQKHVDVMIEDGRFVSISATGTPPDIGAVDLIEGGGAHLVPGLWESHTHVTGFAKAKPAEERLPSLRGTLRGYAAAGITTVCDLGGDLDLELAARRELGPDPTAATLHFAGPCFTSLNGWPLSLHKDRAMAFEVQDAISARRDAERIIDHVDFLKCIFDGKPSVEDRVPVEALTALADVAHDRGKKLIVHVAVSADVRDAVSAGADCIEHAYVPDHPDDVDDARAMADLMADAGTLFCPTLVTWEQLHRGDRSYLDELVDSGLITELDAEAIGARPGFGRPFPHHPVDEAKVRFEQGMKTLRTFHEAGVGLVAGSDVAISLPSPDKALLREIQLFARAGIPGADVLRSATGRAAQRIGADGRAGTIVQGAVADAVLLNADPSDDVTAALSAQAIRMVLRAGVPIVQGAPQ